MSFYPEVEIQSTYKLASFLHQHKQAPNWSKTMYHIRYKHSNKMLMVTYPCEAWCTWRPSNPSILGILGPVKSISNIPILNPWCMRLNANCVVTDDLPTPPFPDNTRTMCLIFERLVSAMGEKCYKKREERVSDRQCQMPTRSWVSGCIDDRSIDT